MCIRTVGNDFTLEYEVLFPIFTILFQMPVIQKAEFNSNSCFQFSLASELYCFNINI